jgi:hypothetical protein
MIVWFAHVKVGHRQAPNKQQCPPSEGIVVSGKQTHLILYEFGVFLRLWHSGLITIVIFSDDVLSKATVKAIVE